MSTDNVIYYLVIDGDLWLLNANGLLQLLVDESAIDDTIEILQPGEYSLSVNEEGFPIVNIDGRAEVVIESLQNYRLSDDAQSVNPQSQAPILANDNAALAQFIQFPDALPAQEVSVGYTSRTTPLDLGNGADPDASSNDIVLNAAIEVQFEHTNAGQYYNAVEVSERLISIAGTVSGVDPSEPIVLTIQDSDPTTADIIVNTVNNGGSYRIENLDISGLAEGDLTVIASVLDRTGEIITASDTAIKDTLADIQATFTDTVYNKVEVDSGQVALATQILNVELGPQKPAEVRYTFTDSLANQVSGTINASSANQVLSIPVAVFTELAEGAIEINLEVQDIAGNIATTEAVTLKDTVASLSATVRGGAELSATELDAVVIDFDVSATINNTPNTQSIEDQQIISVAIDGVGSGQTPKKYQFEIPVDSSNFFSQPLDLLALGFIDGPLTISAQVVDLAGNIAESIEVGFIDQVANLNLQFDGDVIYSTTDASKDSIDAGDGVAEASQVTLSGDVFDAVDGTTATVEDGQIVSILVTGLTPTGASVELETQATIVNGRFVTPRLDLIDAGFGNGAISATANVVDVAGNIAPTASALAEIDIEVDLLSLAFDGDLAFGTSDDALYDSNNANDMVEESQQITLSGTVSGALDGDRVIVTISGLNSNGDIESVQVETTVLNNTYTAEVLTSIDTFADGTLTAEAVVIDFEENQAEKVSSNQALLDTSAEISIAFDLTGDDDGIFNRDDFSAVTVNGSVADLPFDGADVQSVEDGQLVQIIFERAEVGGGLRQSAPFFAEIRNGEFSTTQDLTGLIDDTTNDTPLLVKAEVLDSFGNKALADDAVPVDTRASIFIEFIEEDYNKQEVDTGQVTARVEIRNIEVGRGTTADITYTIEDVSGTTVTNTLTLSDAIQIFRIPLIDFQGLDDGQVKISAISQDLAGNPAVSPEPPNETLKDTVAELAVAIEVLDPPNAPLPDDNLLGEDESVVQLSFDANGLVNGQNAQTLDATNVITFILEGFAPDGSPKTFQDTLAVPAGLTTGDTFASNAIDLIDEGFGDGPLTVSATVTDTVGNPASADTGTVLDFTAGVSLVFEGDSIFSTTDALTLDNNAPGDSTPEVEQVRLSGNVFDSDGNPTVEDFELNGDRKQVEVTITDSEGTVFSPPVFADLVNGEFRTDALDLSSLADGPITAIANVVDNAGNDVDSSVAQAAIDTIAELDSAGFNQANYFSGDYDSAIFSGQTEDVDQGQIVDIEITGYDLNGDEITGVISAGVLADGRFVTAPIADTLSFADGDLEAVVSGFDAQGNAITLDAAFDPTGLTASLDTTATMSVQFDQNDIGDGVINAAEITNVSVSGQIDQQNYNDSQRLSIEDTQTVTLTFTSLLRPDTSPIEISGVDIQPDGAFNVTADLSSLVTVDATLPEYLDSPLVLVDSVNPDIGQINDQIRVTATAMDVAGNHASATNDIAVDVVADLSLQFDGDKFYSTQIVNNPDTEAQTVTLSGQTEGFGDGAILNIVVTSLIDSSFSMPVTASVANVDSGTGVGDFITAQLDLSSFPDGGIQAEVIGVDSSGNTASDEDFAEIDQTAEIDVQFDQTPANNTGLADDGVYNALEATQARIFGDVTDVESTNDAPGNTVTIRVTSQGPSPKTLEIANVPIQPDGSYSVSVDLTAAFSDNGTQVQFSHQDILDVSAEVTDVAGNTATSDGESVELDLVAEVTLQFAGDGLFSNQLSGTGASPTGDTDNLIDDPAIPEVSEVVLIGDVRDGSGDPSIQAGQEVTIILSGTDRVTGQFITYEVSPKVKVGEGPVEFGAVEPFKFITPAIDLLDPLGDQSISFADGTVTARAIVSDLAGNEAVSNDAEAVIDTTVFIDFDDQLGGDPTQDGSQLEGLRLGNAVVFAGTTDAEVLDTQGGQKQVVLTLSDGTVSKTFLGDIVAGVGGTNTWRVENVKAPEAPDPVFDDTIEWTVTVDVLDNAGNTAQDDLPTIILPTPANFNESDIEATGPNSFNGVANATSVILSQNADHTFAPLQTFLSAVTSDGQSLSFSVETDFQLIAVRDGDGVKVFEADLSGNILTMALSAPIDNDAGNTSQLLISSTQTDGDGTTETLISPVSLSILDSRPTPAVDEASVTELNSVSGNLLSNDEYVDQPGLVTEVSFNGNVLSLDGAFNEVVDGSGEPIGLLSVTSDGLWTFLAAGDRVNAVTPEVFEFDYKMEDGDGSKEGLDADPPQIQDTSKLIIEVSDGVPGRVLASSARFEEGKVGVEQNLLDAGKILIQAGSDAIDENTVRFVDDATLNTRINLFSDGIALEFSRIDGQTIVATKQGSGEEVLKFELSAEQITDASPVTEINGVTANAGDAVGTIEVTKSRPIDHVITNNLGEPVAIDELSFFFRVLASDIDGTNTVSANFDWTIDDGADIEKSLLPADTVALTLNESDLSDASAEISGTGQIKLFAGSDQITSLGFSDTNQPAVTSGGKNVYYKFGETSGAPDPTKLIGYVNSTEARGAVRNDSAVNDASDDLTVFEITLTDPLTSPTDSDTIVPFELTLDRGLDQTNGQPLALPIVVQATDRDGDVTEAPLDISVTDGQAPAITNTELVVEETPEKIAGKPDQQDEATLNIQAGIDPLSDVIFTVSSGDIVRDLLGDPVTQNGKALRWSISADNREATAQTNAGDDVFVLTLPSGDIDLAPFGSTDISVAITLLGPVDQLNGDLLEFLDVQVAGVDSDGSTGTGNVVVNIRDGQAIELQDPSTEVSLSVYESDIEGDAAQASVNNAIQFTNGSDDLRLVSPDKAAFDAQQYTSGGELVVLSTQRQNGFWIGELANPDVNGNTVEVFRVKFANNGSVEFILNKALDHIPPLQPPELTLTAETDITDEDPVEVVEDNNTLDLEFLVRGIDADNDETQAKMVTVTVTDDIPEEPSTPLVATRTEGESFETNIFNPPIETIEGVSPGADGARLIRLDVAIEANGQRLVLGTPVDALGPDTVVNLRLPASTDVIGTLTVRPDGYVGVVTNEAPVTGTLVYDIKFYIEDQDGDVITTDTQLNILDAIGEITYDDTPTKEDQLIPLDFLVDQGDDDQGEDIFAVLIEASALDGGTVLNGVPAVEVQPVEFLGERYYVFLEGTDFTPSGVDGSVQLPNLNFRPEENVSSENSSYQLDVFGLINKGSDVIDDAESAIAFLLDLIAGNTNDGVLLSALYNLEIESVADTPEWDPAGIYTYEINEDYQDTNPAVTETPLNLSPFALFGKDSVSSTAGRDNDGSEVLTFRLQGIPDELIIEQNGVPVDSTMILESLDGLTVRPDENVSGTFTFDVISIATEQNPAAGATSAEISKESAPQQITFEVTGVADEPTVNAKNITSFEDLAIDIKSFANGALTDVGGEELFFILTLPTDWTVNSFESFDVATNTYTVAAAAVTDGSAKVTPAPHVSSVDNNGQPYQIQVQTKAIENAGLADETVAFSAVSISNVKLIGVADLPSISDAGKDNDVEWVYTPPADPADNGSITIGQFSEVREDEPFRLDFLFKTEDLQNTEINSVLVKDLPDGAVFVDGNNEIIDPPFPISGLDDNGKPIYNIPVTQFDENGPAQNISTVLTLFSDTFIRVEEDFSGDFTFTLTQISTEPDGDSTQKDIDVLVPITPVVDTNGSDFSSNKGFEDNQSDSTGKLPINLLPRLQDIDSETVVGLTITDVEGGRLFIRDADDSSIETEIFPPFDIDFDFFTGTNEERIDKLNDLLNSDNILFEPAEDRSVYDGTPFPMDVTATYTIQDTADNGLITTSTFSKTVAIKLDPIVETDSRLNVDIGNSIFAPPAGVNQIELDGSAYFVDADLDGSETLDYIFLKMPNAGDQPGAGDGWFVDVQPGSGRTAVHDGKGTWLIDAQGLSSNTVRESEDLNNLQYILDDLILYRNGDTAGFELITVGARVLDSDRAPDRFQDAELIETQIGVKFTGLVEQDDAAVPKDIFDGEIIATIDDSFKVEEDQVIQIGEYLQRRNIDLDVNQDNDLSKDPSGPDDVISYRIEKADLPFGARGAGFRATGMKIEYDTTGERVVAYVFPEAGLADLRMVNLNEDFAGTLEIPILAIASDPSGDLETDEQLIKIQIDPVVDGAGPNPDGSLEFDEDEARSIQGFGVFEDQPRLIEAGLESFDISQYDESADVFDRIFPAVFKVPAGAALFGAAADGTAYVLDITNPSAPDYNPDIAVFGITPAGIANLAEVFLTPPENYPRLNPNTGEFESEFPVQIDYIMQDEAQTFANGGTGTTVVSEQMTLPISFVVNPITDGATLPLEVSFGDEDSDVFLDGVRINLTDIDGTETNDVKFSNVPAGAIIRQEFDDNGTIINLSENLGLDDSGSGTYAWGIDIGKIDESNIFIVPQADFSGLLSLNLTVISEDRFNGDFVTKTGNAEVVIRPIADGLQSFGDIELEYETEEDTNNLVIDLNSVETLELNNPDEKILLKVTIDPSSDLTAIEGLIGISAEGENAAFTFDSTTNTTFAELTLDQTSLDTFSIDLGELAFGSLKLNLEVRSVDEKRILLTNYTDISADADSIIEQLTIEIAPKVDEPILTSTIDNIVTVDNSEIDLGLNLTLQSPAPDETGFITLSFDQQPPAGISFNLGSQVGANQWVVELDDVPNLAIVIGDLAPAEVGVFVLTATPTAELNDDILPGAPETIALTIVDEQDPQAQLNAPEFDADTVSVIQAGAFEDEIVFGEFSAGVAQASRDVINDFDVTNDIIDISLAQTALTDGQAYTNRDNLALIEDGDDSVIVVYENDNLIEENEVQRIVLFDTSLDELDTTNTAGLPPADILSNLIDDQVLIIS